MTEFTYKELMLQKNNMIHLSEPELDEMRNKLCTTSYIKL
ncbi:MAG: hypothetical protein ACI86M_003095 [Saprospiraceae bacterium]|jgi:hypothetical protein